MKTCWAVQLDMATPNGCPIDDAHAFEDRPYGAGDTAVSVCGEQRIHIGTDIARRWRYVDMMPYSMPECELCMRGVLMYELAQ